MSNLVVGRPRRLVLGLGLLLVDLVIASPALSLETANAAAIRPTPYPGGRWEPGPAKFGATEVDDVAVKMDDGIVLRASIAYPTDLATGKRAAGAFPVVVEHTPYVRFANPVAPLTFFAEHGYITVVVRARGTGASEGTVELFSPRDGLDGKAIVNWAAHDLEGSDGRVAMIGCSYPGGLALLAAAQVGRDSPLKAVVAACVGLNNVNRQSWMVDGLPTTGFANYSAYGAALWGDSPPAKKFFDFIVTGVMKGQDPAYERAFWGDRIPIRLAKDIVDNDVPVLLWSGWGDIVETGAVRAYTDFQNAHAHRPLGGPMAPGQATTPRYQLIMGNWEHGGGLDLGVYLEWIETWLNGVDTGIQKTTTAMHAFEAGSGRWTNLAGYPAVKASTPLYLGRSERLETVRPSADGKNELRWGPPERPHGRLTFTTQPLERGVTLAGPISATIYARSRTRNLELIARVYDVGADGAAVLISKGAVLGSQRALDRVYSWADSSGVVTWPWPTLNGDDYPEVIFTISTYK